jgi:ABC-type cobalamin/Fe3+-siderophores transport system ATPase subunit
LRLAIEHLSKVYKGNIRALKDFSLEAASVILGVLGPNGAGQSTLMRILATITKATHRTVTWNGVETARRRIDELLAVVNLEDSTDRRSRDLGPTPLTHPPNSTWTAYRRIVRYNPEDISKTVAEVRRPNHVSIQQRHKFRRPTVNLKNPYRARVR